MSKADDAARWLAEEVGRLWEERGGHRELTLYRPLWDRVAEPSREFMRGLDMVEEGSLTPGALKRLGDRVIMAWDEGLTGAEAAWKQRQETT